MRCVTFLLMHFSFDWQAGLPRLPWYLRSPGLPTQAPFSSHATCLGQRGGTSPGQLGVTLSSCFTCSESPVLHHGHRVCSTTFGTTSRGRAILLSVCKHSITNPASQWVDERVGALEQQGPTSSPVLGICLIGTCWRGQQHHNGDLCLQQPPGLKSKAIKRGEHEHHSQTCRNISNSPIKSWKLLPGNKCPVDKTQATSMPPHTNMLIFKKALGRS